VCVIVFIVELLPSGQAARFETVIPWRWNKKKVHLQHRAVRADFIVDGPATLLIKPVVASPSSACANYEAKCVPERSFC
ncbi:MAG: hypothetical protein RLN67_12160, partial [Algiphilus sp.]